MRGLINAALQDIIGSEGKQHPFVVLPMLNVDGTVHGWYVSTYFSTNPLEADFLLILGA